MRRRRRKVTDMNDETVVLPDIVFLIALPDDMFVAAAPPGEEVVALLVFVRVEDATNFAASLGPEGTLVELHRDKLVDSVRLNVREQTIPDGYVWVVEGESHRLEDVLSSYPHNVTGDCRYCGAADIDKGNRETLSIPYTGVTVNERRIDVAVRIGVIRCSTCGHRQVEKITFPLDPDSEDARAKRSGRKKPQ